MTAHPTTASTALVESGDGRSHPTADHDPTGEREPAGSGRGVSLGSAIGTVVAMLGFLMGSRVIRDNSFLTHLATGRETLYGAGLPVADVFSYTASGDPVTVQSWLPGVVYAWLDHVAGPSSIRVLHGVLGALVAVGTWRLTAAARQLIPRLAIVGLLLGIGAMMWSPRPLMFGLLGLVGLFLVRQRDLPLWSLIPIMWFWANSHGSFPLGLAAVAAFALGSFLDDRAVPWRDLRVLAWASLGVLGAAVNPLGWRLLWFPMQLLSRSEALDGVAEWGPPSFKEPLGLILLLIGGMLVVAAKNGARWEHLLPGLCFVAASLLAVRNLAPAAIVFAVVLAPYFEIGDATLTSSTRGFFAHAVALAAGAGLAIGVVAASAETPYDLSRQPVDQVDWLDGRGLVARTDVRLIHRDTVGNYLEYRYGTAANVFVDDRFDFYPLDLLADHRGLFFGDRYRDILDRHDADVVLWANTGGFAEWLREADGWTVARDEGDWMVACRIAGPVSDRCLD